MILTCPECETQFRVADNAIPQGGRVVRCASCKHEWHAYSDDQAGELTPPPPPEPETQPFEELPSFAAVQEPNLDDYQKDPEEADADEDDPVEHEAEEIEEAVSHSLPHDVDEEGRSLDDDDMPHIHFPGTENDKDGLHVTSLKPIAVAASVLLLLVAGTLSFLVAPSLFGVSSSEGLSLADVEMRERKGRDNVRYVVEGKILNASGSAQPVPTLRIALVGKDGDTILSREYEAEDGLLLPDGEAYPFAARNLQTTQIDRVDYLLIDIGNGVELMKRPLYWVASE